jgi:hypothetical protein
MQADEGLPLASFRLIEMTRSRDVSMFGLATTRSYGRRPIQK